MKKYRGIIRSSTEPTDHNVIWEFENRFLHYNNGAWQPLNNEGCAVNEELKPSDLIMLANSYKVERDYQNIIRNPMFKDNLDYWSIGRDTDMRMRKIDTNLAVSVTGLYHLEVDSYYPTVILDNNRLLQKNDSFIREANFLLEDNPDPAYVDILIDYQILHPGTLDVSLGSAQCNSVWLDNGDCRHFFKDTVLWDKSGDFVIHFDGTIKIWSVSVKKMR